MQKAYRTIFCKDVYIMHYSTIIIICQRKTPEQKLLQHNFLLCRGDHRPPVMVYRNFRWSLLKKMIFNGITIVQGQLTVTPARFLSEIIIQLIVAAVIVFVLTILLILVVLLIIILKVVIIIVIVLLISVLLVLIIFHKNLHSPHITKT